MEQASDGGLDSTSLARLKGRVGTLDQQCRAFLRANARQLVLAEEALRGLALAAPGGDSEVRAELANTVLGLLGVYRDSFPNETTRNSNLPLIILSSLRTSQVLVEVLSERRIGRRNKFVVLLFLEIVKAALQLVLLSRTSPGQPLTAESERLPLAIPPHTCAAVVSPLDVEQGKRSGRLHITLATVKRQRDLEDLFAMVYNRQSSQGFGGLLKEKCEGCLAEKENGNNSVEGTIGSERTASAFNLKAIGARECRAGNDSLHTRRTRSLSDFAEILRILRPTLYLCLVRAFGWKSWRAWCASLAIDCASIALMERKGFEKERTRRTMALIFYFARSPFFDVVSKAIMLRLSRILAKLPLVGGYIQTTSELATKLQTYYFYTSSS